jgi:hypothetical protein
MDAALIEIPILNFKYHFRLLTWLEEFSINFPKNKNAQRIMLAHALVDVSGLPIESVEAATRVLDPIPSPLISRMFVIYRGSVKPSRKFEVASIYRAPEPSAYAKRVREENVDQEAQMEKMHDQLESTFGAKELAEARALEQAIVTRAKDPKTGVPRGAVVKPEEELDAEDRKDLKLNPR